LKALLAADWWLGRVKLRLEHLPTAPWWQRALALGALAFVLSLISWAEMLGHYPNTQQGDGQVFHEMLEAVRVSIVDYHELPLWNPYQCGGAPLWDNPEGLGAAPVVLALLPLGTTIASELSYVVHSALGFVCMWLFVRNEIKLSRGAALVASAAFAFAGVHNQHLTGGHPTFAPYLYYPLALLFWRRAESDLRAAVGLGALVALMMHEGGTYPLPQLALFLGLETVTRLWPPRRLLPIARAAAVVVVVGICLGASRFLPVIDQLRAHPRQLGEEHDAMKWQTVWDAFFARDHGRGVVGQEYAWTEYGDYMGPVLFVLSVLGILLGGLENAWMLVLLGVAFALMIGHFGPLAPASILKAHVYPFKQMRVPSRFVAWVAVFLAAYAGVAVDRLRALANRLTPGKHAPEVRAAILVVGLLGAADLMAVGIRFGAQFFNEAPAGHPPASPRLTLGGKDMAAFIDQPRQHRGRVECWEEWAFGVGAPLWQGDVPQARAASPKAVIRSVDRTQNTFTVEVHASAPSRVLLNTAYDRGWTSSVGTVVEKDKLLAVDVPAGDFRMVVRYWPRGLTPGLWLSGITVTALVAFWVWRGRRRRALPMFTL